MERLSRGGISGEDDGMELGPRLPQAGQKAGQDGFVAKIPEAVVPADQDPVRRAIQRSTSTPGTATRAPSAMALPVRQTV